MNLFDYMLRNRSEVLARSFEHIGLVAASMAIALVSGCRWALRWFAAPRCSAGYLEPPTLSRRFRALRYSDS